MKRILQIGSLITLLFCIVQLSTAQIISQYVETNSGTTPKGIEIWNNTGTAFDFATNNLEVQQGTNGGQPSTLYTFSSGTLNAGEVLVLGTSDMETVTVNNGSAYYAQNFQFNGNDALVIKFGGVTTDVFGNPGTDPGSSWSGNGVSTANQNIGILAGITTGDTDGWTDPSERFETISTDPAGTNGLQGFGVAPDIPSTSVISVSPLNLTNFTYPLGAGPSASQSFEVSGTGLTGNIVVNPSSSYEISSDNSTFQSTGITLNQSGGTVVATEIFIRLKAGLSAGTYNEQVDVTSSGATTVSLSCSGSVTTGEPTSHPTNFTATANTTETITVTWNDSDAENYLLKGSDAGYDNITAPSDGIAESNSLLVQNVAQGVESHVFNGLAAGTTYYFKIYPYNGSGATINYKTDGIVPQDDATTENPENMPDLVITEVMQNPSVVNDSEGEWFEIYNAGASDVDIDGFVITDLGSDAHTIDNGGPLTISAGGYLVFGVNADFGINGGVNVDYQYSGISLANGDDELILYMPDGTTVVDQVAWDGGPVWPDPNGASMTLNPAKLNATDNDDGSNWYEATSTYGAGDLGTPGAPNDHISTTWTGAISNTWNEAGNWSAGIPDSGTDAIIPDVSGAKAPLPVISGTATCFNLTLSTGASLEIASSGALTVSGTLTNNGNLMVKSDATGNGSLIEYSGANATVEAYVPASEWQFVSSPIDNANTSIFAGIYMQWWDEVTGLWNWVYSADSVLATDFQGYSVWPPTSTTLTFSGTLNAGNRSIGLTNTPSSAFTWPGYNFVGNPYPSGIDWDGSGWTKSNVDNAIYVWNGVQYAAYVGGTGTFGQTNEIPPHQGFFVHCNNTGGGALDVSDDARIHTTEPNLKNNYAGESLMIAVEGNGYHDETILSLQEEATLSFDSHYDAYKLRGSADAPQLFTLSNDDKELSINAMPDVPAKAIQLNFEAGIDGIFELSLSDISGFEGIPVFLEDKKEHKVINFKNYSIYKFYAAVNDDPHRFNLHFSYAETPSQNDSPQYDGIWVYSGKQKVIVASEKDISGTVMVYDLSGRVVASEAINGSNYLTLDTPVETGYYIVSVIDGQQITNRKIQIP